MRVAQQLARCLGTDVHFDELEGEEEEDVPQPQQQQQERQTTTTTTATLRESSNVAVSRDNTTTKLKHSRFRQTDPDAEYQSSDDSDDDDDDDDTSQSASSVYSDDSDWDASVVVDDEDDNNAKNNNLIPYDLEDDEEDLCATPRPLYLNECLDYLRSSPQDDGDAGSRHEACLRELPRLVRARPADLADLGPELARSVLRLENISFAAATSSNGGGDEFADCVAACLQALVVEDPLQVGPHLIEELFQDGTLKDRVNVLAALERGARELSGLDALEEASCRTSTESGTTRQRLMEGPKISGKRSLVQSEQRRQPTTARLVDDLLQETNNDNNNRTRRWGRGRLRQVESASKIQNRFGNVAPVWFYTLIGNFVKHKEDVAMWEGSIGAQLLSNLFLTLTRVVECTGPYTPGVDLLAKDLFELVWGFRNAEIPEVRAAVLYAVSRSIALLPEETLFGLLLDDDSSDNLAHSVQSMMENDPDEDCRTLAGMLTHSVTSTLQAIGQQSPMLLM